MRSVFETPPMFLPCRLKTDISPPSEGENSKFQGTKKRCISGAAVIIFLQKSQRETDVFQVFQNNSPTPFTAGGLYAILKLQKCNTERK